MVLLQEEHADSLDATAQEYVAFARDGADRMSVLVSDLLRFSQVGAEAITLESVPLSDVFAEVLTELQSMLKSSGATVEVPELPVVKADRNQLLHVVRNLLSNALKFRRPDHSPLIRVSGIERERDILVEIEDNGIGFEARYAGKMFRMFQRLNARSKFSGTGIGLAICKRAIERHHGAIGARSERNHGSVFWFTLPKDAPK